MKFLPVAAFVILTLVSTSLALDPKDPNPPARPLGVEESKWSRITDTLGFVVTRDVQRGAVKNRNTGEKREVIINKQVTGYFMILREGVWCRVEIEPSAARPMPLTTAK